MRERLGVKESEAVDMEVARPVPQAVHYQPPYDRMPAVQHAIAPAKEDGRVSAGCQALE